MHCYLQLFTMKFKIVTSAIRNLILDYYFYLFICKWFFSYLPYIPEYKPRILGGFYKAKVGGSAYIQVYALRKKITS